MRAVLAILGIVLLLVVGLIAAGWMTFSKSDDEATIRIDTGEIESDVKQAVDRGAEGLKRTGEKVDQAIDTEDGRAAD